MLNPIDVIVITKVSPEHIYSNIAINVINVLYTPRTKD